MYRGSSCGKESKTDSSTAIYVGKWIYDLVGTVPTKDNAETILRGHSKTPKCFLLLKVDEYLVKGMMTAEERLQNRVDKNESTTDLESSDTWAKTKRKSQQKNCHLMPSSAVNLISSF